MNARVNVHTFFFFLCVKCNVLFTFALLRFLFFVVISWLVCVFVYLFICLFEYEELMGIGCCICLFRGVEAWLLLLYRVYLFNAIEVHI